MALRIRLGLDIHSCYKSFSVPSFRTALLRWRSRFNFNFCLSRFLSRFLFFCRPISPVDSDIHYFASFRQRPAILQARGDLQVAQVLKSFFFIGFFFSYGILVSFTT
jgi:hypothetical protein